VDSKSVMAGGVTAAYLPADFKNCPLIAHGALHVWHSTGLKRRGAAAGPIRSMRAAGLPKCARGRVEDERASAKIICTAR
jgi:hypothetical protein